MKSFTNYTKQVVSVVTITAGLVLATTANAQTLDQTEYEEVLVKKLKATQSLVLKGKTASVQKKGSRAFKIKDDLQVTGKTTLKKRLDVRGAIVDRSDDTVTVNDNLVPKTASEHDLGTSELLWDNLYVNNIIGATIDGVNVTALSNTVDTLSGDVTTLEGQVATLEATTDNDTTYTAGDGITLTGTTFSSDLGTSIDASEISNPTRSIQLPIGSWTTVEGSTPQLLSVSTTPNLNSSTETTARVVEWISGEDLGTTASDYMSNTVFVPDDYVGSAQLHLLMEHSSTSFSDDDEVQVNWTAVSSKSGGFGDFAGEDFSGISEETETASHSRDSGISSTAGDAIDKSISLDSATIEAGDLLTLEVGFSDIDDTWRIYAAWFEYESEQ